MMSLYCIVKMGNWARDLVFISFPLHLLLLNLIFIILDIALLI